MEEGKEEKPLTREDVLRLIEEHGGSEGLDLSGKKFEEGIDLSGLDLHGIILRAHLFRAKFNGSNLDGADFCHANLMYAEFNSRNSKPASLVHTDLRDARLDYAEFRDADLTVAKFGGPEGESHMKARLDEADLRDANLFRADFNGCFLYGTKLQGALIRGADLIGRANLAEADWGNHIIGEEQKGYFGDAERQYRYLKKWYTSEGMHDIAGEFYFREMEMKKKALGQAIWQNLRGSWRERKKAFHLFERKELGNWLRLSIYGAICGYAERPWHVFLAAFFVIFGLAGLYTAFGSFSSGTFPDCLYYSTASFTALGYGSWSPQPEGWAKAIGAAEAVIGVSMITLFLVTFTRKMVR